MPTKRDLSERDICTKYITPAIEEAGWNIETQVREEVSFTEGKIIVRDRLRARGKRKRADFILYYKPNIPIALIEAKDNRHAIGDGIQQGLNYARILDIPFVYSSNGDGFLEHDPTASFGEIERSIGLDEFPTPAELWRRYKIYKGIDSPEAERVVTQDYFFDPSGKSPRYYQTIAINRTVEAIAKGQNRILLVMATGTGKTYVAFQIIHRLWKAGVKKRILFLADRNALIRQTKRDDFRHFRDKMTVIRKKIINKSYEIYLALYQGLTDYDEDKDAYKEFSPDFFDLVIIDECHRGSAAADSAWREILTYFSSATHIGLTATPKETKDVSNIDYFGEPIYTYSLKQGIEDGFLAPYKVIRVGIDKDLEGWRPGKGKTDVHGFVVEDRTYNLKDYDKNLVIQERTKLVAKRISEFLKKTNRFDKTIVFCVDIDHAQRMRERLINENPDLIAQNDKYIMRITGDNPEGKRELDNFINPEERYPVIATTSKLMTTGVNTQTCKVIVLDSNINSTTEFKQIIGRGTRINEEYDKYYFTIIDFRNVTDKFADPEFDGEPVKIYEPGKDDPIVPDEDDDFPIIDADGEEVIISEPPEIPPGGSINLPPFRKITVNGVPVKIVNERVQYYDKDGKLITESLRDFTKKNIIRQFQTADRFQNVWNRVERKQQIIRELEEQGILLYELQQEIGKDYDVFDLICHIAFGMPPLTRQERAKNVKKRNYFTKYGEKARQVLERLLDKYAETDIVNIENPRVLELHPIKDLGTKTEIIKAFGGVQAYKNAISELEREIYKGA